PAAGLSIHHLLRPLLAVDAALEDAEQGLTDLLLAERRLDLLAEEIGDVEDVDRLLAIGADMGGADGEAEIGNFAGQLVQQAGAIEAHDLDDGELAAEGVGDGDLRGHGERLEAPVVAAVLAEVDEHLAATLQQLLDRVDDAGCPYLLVLVGGEGAAQAEGIDRATVSGSEDLGADNRSIAHGAGPGDQRQQPRVVRGIEADLGNAFERLHADGP